MEPGRDDPIRQLRESVERRLERERRFRFDREDGFGVPDRFGFPLLVAFTWFWFSWMSFGVWAFFFGEVVPDGEEVPPWPLKMYLGIPVAAAFGAIVAFVWFRGVPWRRKPR